MTPLLVRPRQSGVLGAAPLRRTLLDLYRVAAVKIDQQRFAGQTQREVFWQAQVRILAARWPCHGTNLPLYRPPAELARPSLRW